MRQYVWWHSGYDRLCHAFSTRQASAAYFEAACTHSVPPEYVVRERSGTLCVPCLVEVGSTMEEDHAWRG
ncbi:hypothetical protein LZG04_06440 [Saccharothrix sp. S26]|uniref:hypothetical protein n=1 Tax=Saccharothrix sp. S26 TaxID=2907215 RepID=UPI001F479FF5|nr:hypothetical protein [Saccharothrix sp. S26]MCE6994446.1 hypothetical protein [Saccharothrix sp. S26]